ncbi:protein-L-isoaspartate, putative [Trypanosoma equiperdum]|uniref:protein-L-isoaspartate(D-aspartate) O-methyltransferase n=3 Tax=Trypanozoon TaxID=39700 RepID=Q38AH9_TRYB2|nr:protein-L-isoaspartate, putative [Trypanosoma brucei gambiense DAL972]XP_823019.1 protein-L-isoaspartate, putative [Trypanosoma brucei brucei TREU927]EAN78191.1 protein-L-isoaspartate, putative [Trypanosoma brucei brucei TREU927]CBH15870.1 protein-L-isoaspartate, putative [Trypanosoma brucei gambiense DAL972]SCU64632.1 protein-L-isoaspartate, putative [Trypanosoma equiperdum]|eukprot:XP_011778134.1 protein-L-isoaspartate, putative [Trypanosoma brucei gambiense DAL972]
MAWTCSGVTNAGMIQRLEAASLLVTPAVIEAFRRVDRGWFLPHSPPEVAYSDQPVPIGYGATISAPHMHAIMVEIIAPFLLRTPEGVKPATVLDVGSGSGYLTAVLAELCSGRGGTVIGVEHISELVVRSTEVVNKHFRSWVEEGRIKFIEGDGRNITGLLGQKVPDFDVIHVGAAAATVPQVYIDALKPGGCLVIPVGREGEAQTLRVYTKDMDGHISSTNHGGVRFVPLTSAKHQRGGI